MPLNAESAAHFRCDDSDEVLRHSEHLGDVSAHEVRHLCRRPQGHAPAINTWLGDATTSLEGDPCLAVVPSSDSDRAQLLFSRRTLAMNPGSSNEDIVLPALMENRCLAVEGILNVDDRRQLLVMYAHRFRRFFSDVRVVMENRNNGLADVTYNPVGKAWLQGSLPSRVQHCGCIVVPAFMWLNYGWHFTHICTNPQPREVLSREDQRIVGKLFKLPRNNILDHRVRVLAPHEAEMECSRWGDIIDITRVPGDEPVIFKSRDPITDPSFRDGLCRHLQYPPWQQFPRSWSFVAVRAAFTMLA